MSLIQKKQNIILINSDENNGYAAGNNIGIKKAIEDNCKYIMIVNNDVEFCDECIDKLILAIDMDVNVGIVGPKVYNEDMDMQNYIYVDSLLKEEYLCRTKLRYFFPKLCNKYYGIDSVNSTKNVVVVIPQGCCFLMSRECALKVTPLDEHTFLYMEEFILAKRMLSNNMKILLVPSAIAIHKCGKSSINVRAFAYTCFVCSEIYYCRSYCRANILTILPLYIIRSVAYVLKTIYDKNYRKYLWIFLKRTLYELFIIKN